MSTEVPSGTPDVAQSEMPFAVVMGEPYTRLPTDLYIPPDALEVFLEAFEGPLDLLLYLIRRQNLNILDIPIADITEQYIEYIQMMQESRFELAAEYLLMASMLAEIKSRMLLPRPVSDEEGEEDDPRAELVRRLQEYERFKQAALDIETLPRMERDTFPAEAFVEDRSTITVPPSVELRELIIALRDVLDRAQLYSKHAVKLEPLSVRDRMTRVLSRLDGETFIPFPQFFNANEGRAGVVVTFLAVLELLKAQLIEVVQNRPLGEIHLRAAISAKA